MSIIYKFFKSTAGLLISTISLVLLSVAWVYPFIEDSSNLLESKIGLYTVTLGALVWMLATPILIIKKIFKENLSEYGWLLPKDKNKAIFLTIASLILLAPFMFYFSSQISFQEYYKFESLAVSNFLFSSVLMSFLYYAAEEFLFRGFLFFGLLKKIGKHSFWVTSIIFALLHVSKPGLEIPFSFAASLLLCYLSYETKSFVPAFIVHFLIAVILNGLIAFG